MVNPNDDAIELVDSRHQDWREQFKEERQRLEDVFESKGLTSAIRRIDHVGSTAVPDLAAKDIVDVDIVVEDDAVTAVSTAIESTLGGTRAENSDEWHPIFREEGGQRFNDHVFAHSSPGWRISVAMATILPEQPPLRAEYEQRKREASTETDDLQAYSEAKSTVVRAVLEEADEDRFDFAIPALEQLG